jgi:hypothetical protein
MASFRYVSPERVQAIFCLFLLQVPVVLFQCTVSVAFMADKKTETILRLSANLLLSTKKCQAPQNSFPPPNGLVTCPFGAPSARFSWGFSLFAIYSSD